MTGANKSGEAPSSRYRIGWLVKASAPSPLAPKPVSRPTTTNARIHQTTQTISTRNRFSSHMPNSDMARPRVSRQERAKSIRPSSPC